MPGVNVRAATQRAKPEVYMAYCDSLKRGKHKREAATWENPSTIITSFSNPKEDVSSCAHAVDNVKPEGNHDM
jgi:hypothetical protein